MASASLYMFAARVVDYSNVEFLKKQSPKTEAARRVWSVETQSVEDGDDVKCMAVELGSKFR